MKIAEHVRYTEVKVSVSLHVHIHGVHVACTISGTKLWGYIHVHVHAVNSNLKVTWSMPKTSTALETLANSFWVRGLNSSAASTPLSEKGLHYVLLWNHIWKTSTWRGLFTRIVWIRSTYGNKTHVHTRIIYDSTWTLHMDMARGNNIHMYAFRTSFHVCLVPTLRK